MYAHIYLGCRFDSCLPDFFTIKLSEGIRQYIRCFSTVSNLIIGVCGLAFPPCPPFPRQSLHSIVLGKSNELCRFTGNDPSFPGQSSYKTMSIYNYFVRTHTHVRLSGCGIPWVTSVVSKATTGQPEDMAAATSGRTCKCWADGMESIYL